MDKIIFSSIVFIIIISVFIIIYKNIELSEDDVNSSEIEIKIVSSSTEEQIITEDITKVIFGNNTLYNWESENIGPTYFSVPEDGNYKVTAGIVFNPNPGVYKISIESSSSGNLCENDFTISSDDVVSGSFIPYIVGAKNYDLLSTESLHVNFLTDAKNITLNQNNLESFIEITKN